MHEKFAVFFARAEFNYSDIKPAKFDEKSSFDDIFIKKSMSNYDEIPVVDEVCISYTCNRLFEEINEEQKYQNQIL